MCGPWKDALTGVLILGVSGGGKTSSSGKLFSETDLEHGFGGFGHVRAQGYNRKYGVRPMENAAMRILGNVVKRATFQNGGNPVTGTIQYNQERNRSFLTV